MGRKENYFSVGRAFLNLEQQLNMESLSGNDTVYHYQTFSSINSWGEEVMFNNFMLNIV